MAFVAAKCPQCGGDLQLYDKKETGFCMHCGSKIIVQEAIKRVQIDNTHMVETWMRMGKSAADAKNYTEAYEYFTKVIEVDIENWKAIYYKGKAAGYLSTLSKPRFNEFLQGILEANKIISNAKMAQEEIIEAKNLFVNDLHNLTNEFNKIIENRFEENSDLIFQTDWDMMIETRQWQESAIKLYQLAINLLDEYTDDVTKVKILGFKQMIVDYIVNMCDSYSYYTDFSKEQERYFGFTAEEKKPYIDLYDQLVIEIRREIPDYKTGDYIFIDRLDPPKGNEDENGRIDRLILLEKEIDIIRRKQEEEFQKQQYWKYNPGEYNKHLEKIEKQKNMLIVEIAGKVKELEEMEKSKDIEIQKLKNEREKLGLFVANRKKEIDTMVEILEQKYQVLRKEIETLNKELQEIEN